MAPMYLPILSERAWFMSADPVIVRAGLYMYDEAWRSRVPGSLPASMASLASVCRISEALLLAHYEALTDGWELREDGRLYEPLLHKIAVGVEENFGAQIAVVAQGSILAIQGSAEVFDLVPSDPVKSRRRNTAKVPVEQFAPDATSVAALLKAGYKTADQQSWVIGHFCDYLRAKAPKYRDIQALFRNSLCNPYTVRQFQTVFGHALGAEAPSAPALLPGGRSVGMGDTFAAKTLATNRAVLAGAAMALRNRQTSGPPR